MCTGKELKKPTKLQTGCSRTCTEPTNFQTEPSLFSLNSWQIWVLEHPWHCAMSSSHQNTKFIQGVVRSKISRRYVKVDGLGETLLFTRAKSDKNWMRNQRVKHNIPAKFAVSQHDSWVHYQWPSFPRIQMYTCRTRTQADENALKKTMKRRPLLWWREV